MKKRTSRWGCVFVVLLFLVLLSVGGWWIFRLQGGAVETSDASPILVFIISPSNGAEFKAGDFVPVALKSTAPSAVQSAELFVDGQSLGKITDVPQDASWTWQAWPVGIHTFVGRVTTADGQTGDSQTVMVNVLAGDGVMEVAAGDGQTLEQIGSGFGVPPDQMAGVNPQIDPSQPLSGGQPVQVPAGGAGAGNGSGPGGGPSPGNGFPLILITWKFQPTEPVDESYCYSSTGDGIWDKIPSPPFEFITGDNSYTQFFDLMFPGPVFIQMQCWGWLGGTLKYLGQGETQFDAQQPPNELTISGDGFIVVGIPQIPTQPENFTGGGGLTIPPPFALREPKDAAECTSHGTPLLAAFICDTLMNVQVKEYVILVWEWAPETCWPGSCQYGVKEIDGYRLYEIDPLTLSKTYLKDVTSQAQKVSAIPLPWGAKCYGVRAYVDDPAIADSDMAMYCPDVAPVPQKITLTPTMWLTTGGQWIESGDCDTYGGADAYALANQDGFGNQAGQVLVGSYIVDDDDEDCYREGSYSGGVKFDHPALPANAVLQQATLKFSSVFVDYGATALAAPKPSTCVATVGKAKQDWSSLVGGNHFSASPSLSSTAYNSPLASLSSFASPSINVTSVVSHWLKHSANNHGFILSPAAAPHPIDDGSGECLSGLGNFQLEIYYFAP